MLALDHITILDMGRLYPPSYTCMILADYGANVIRVDSPNASFPDPDVDINDDRFPAIFAPSRNKKSVVFNLKSKPGIEAFYKLVKKADVLAEGFKPGVTKRLHIDYETLNSINPNLIYCSMTGYGQTGPYASMTGHDMNFISISGALSLIGPRDGAPCFPSNLLGDVAGAGLHGAIGILMAIIARDKTGKGQFIDLSFTDAVLSMLSVDISRYFFTGKIPKRGETFLTGGNPWAQVFKCSDGEYISIGCGEPKLWENLCKAIDRDDLIPYHNAVSSEKDRVVSEMQSVFIKQTRDYWFESLKDKDVAISPVNNLEEALADPQIRHRQMVLEIADPKLGTIKQAGFPIKMSETPAILRHLGKKLGADTAAVLSGLGYSQQEIDELKAQGAIV